jgi:N,N'-diacetyllegionaminate synthase
MNKIFIVAEIGVNHNGDVNLAKRLIDAAAAAGADAVKTQLFVADKLATARARKAAYQVDAARGCNIGGGLDDGDENCGGLNNGDTDGGSQLAMLKKLELTAEQYALLDGYAKSIGIVLFAAPFDAESIRALARLGCPIFKVPSGEITNLPYLTEIANLAVKVFISTGMSDICEVRNAVNVFAGSGCDLTLLHCHTQYPTEFADANLFAMASLREATGLPVGYSDHTPGIEAAIAAAALSATVVEKHFTLDRALPGPDHRASLEPGEFARLVTSIRNVEAALGDGVKRPTRSEQENLAVARKSIVAARAIRAGEIFDTRSLAAKRPGDGISPMRWHDVIGCAARRDFAVDEQIEL